MEKKVFINTIGCQMNVYDSERIVGILRPEGYTPVESPEAADLIIVNTCTIRQKAEQKAFSFLGRTGRLKRKKPGLIVGIGGCVAQQEGGKILDRMGHVDLVFGTHAISRLPEMIRAVETEGARPVYVDMLENLNGNGVIPDPACGSQVSRFVTIMQGCDNFCTYCVVPHVRGREMSREPDEIISEINGLAEISVREVTLLGQNVNSYGLKEGLCSFSELIGRIHAIEKIIRIRFTTSHPKDLSDELIDAFRDLDKLCNHIHLPVQSGSNRILERMNRKYSREHYLEKIDRLRNNCPDIAISSDIIVGFPGETEADVHETLSLIRQVEFDGLFAFVYSDRPNTPASRFGPKVTEEDGKARLKSVLELQEAITAKKNAEMVGKSEAVLVEGISKKGEHGTPGIQNREIQWTGRTAGNKIVNFGVSPDLGDAAPVQEGDMAFVEIQKALAHSLWGRVIRIERGPSGLKGDCSNAA